MGEEKSTWGDYSKLVLKELERLNDNYDKMRTDFDNRFVELNERLSQVKHIEDKVENHTTWISKVSDVWSPTQMKEAKDELYQQKNRWVAAIAIMTFVQIMISLGVVIWAKLQ